MRRASEVRSQPWQESRRDSGKGQRPVGAENALQRFGHRAIRT
jgi:hypothetical protein